MQRLADAGELTPEIDVRTAAGALFGTLIVVALDWQVFTPERDRAEVRDSVLLLIRGVRGSSGVN